MATASSPHPAGPFAIVTEGLAKTYGARAVVDGVNLRFNAGEIVGLLGPNGAGKTTTFYMIVGLVPPTLGRVQLDGADITRLRMHERARRGIGYLPQEASVFRKLTVEENILAIVEAIGTPRRQRTARVQHHLEELNLGPVAKQRAYTLSGGERRRLEIARALVADPKFLLMDEPFAAIDPISVAEVHKNHSAAQGPRHRHRHHRSQCAGNAPHRRSRLLDPPRQGADGRHGRIPDPGRTGAQILPRGKLQSVGF